MAQLIETKPEVYDRIMDEWGESDPALIGVLLNVISTKKSKQMLKLSKTSPTAEFFMGKAYSVTADSSIEGCIQSRELRYRQGEVES